MCHRCVTLFLNGSVPTYNLYIIQRYGYGYGYGCYLSEQNPQQHRIDGLLVIKIVLFYSVLFSYRVRQIVLYMMNTMYTH